MLAAFHPVVATWFASRFAAPSPPQVEGWRAIHAANDTLIAAPTGSGKTLAAFLNCLNTLIEQALRTGGLPQRTQILYVSPLKALSNDIQRNLQVPLTEIRELGKTMGYDIPPIDVAVRSGDTKPAERQRMVKTPPQILVTTPESFYILLTADRSRAALSEVKTVIVDEIHAVAPSKRGAHLTLSLERLERLVTQQGGARPQRIGLSATQKPIEMIAKMLVGSRRTTPTIVDAGHARELDIAIELTDDELSSVASNEHFGRVLDRCSELIQKHETTLLFVNTRKLVERVSHELSHRLGEDVVVAHHGSLSRTTRFDAEQRLKNGAVKCAVATASLELGIDVGSVDLVIQIGSPRSIATLLQRIGRAGHSLGATPKGRLFATTRDQLIECASLIRAIKDGRLDAIEPRIAPLDVLSQQIVAMAACEELGEDELFDTMRQAWHYADLDRDHFDAVLEILSEGISNRRGRTLAYLHRDRIHGVIKGRRAARLSAITSGGAIPDNANYAVMQMPGEVRVGELDEDFAIESMAGDIFLLGNKSWRILRVESGRVLVEDAQGLPPSIPFWFGEAPARTPELSEEVSRLRGDIEARIVRGEPDDIIASWLAVDAEVPVHGGVQLAQYLRATRKLLGAVPTGKNLIAERFFDEAGGMQLVIHSPFGGRVNRAWGLALRKRFCRSFDFELQAAATDDGLLLSLGEPHSFELASVFEFLRSVSVREILIQAMLDAPMFEVRWRWNSTRSLSVLRWSSGKKVPPHLIRMRANDLLSVVFPTSQACLENVVGDIEIPDHPLVFETVRDCLTEAMDIDRLEQLLRDLESGAIQTIAADTVEPSPMCHELVNANPYAFLDGAPLEERRTRAVMLRRVTGDVDSYQDALAPEAIRTVETEAMPPVRNPDEIHDLLMSRYVLEPTLIAGSGNPDWQGWLDALVADKRVVPFETTTGQTVYTAAERAPIVEAALPSLRATCSTSLPFTIEVPEPEQALVKIVAGYLDYCGPRSARELAEVFACDIPVIEAALIQLETDGAILRGHFSSREELQWCNRRTLARIHRLTLTHLRARIQSVSPAVFMRFLFRWQHVDDKRRLSGSAGLLQIVEQLQGFETAARAWESEVFTARLREYNPDWLDQLCLTGMTAWCRISKRRPEDATTDDESTESPSDAPTISLRRKTTAHHGPNRATPIAIFMREDLDWLRSRSHVAERQSLSHGAQTILDHLETRGADFINNIVGARLDGIERTEQVEQALLELLSAGAISSDGFATLRALISSRHQKARRRRSHRDRLPPALGGLARPPTRSRRLRTATATGRWFVLPPPTASEDDAELFAVQLLRRYGVVFRELLGRESNLPRWREVHGALRRMEHRGEIRGGRFIDGFVGEQFALPEAVDALRALRKQPERDELVVVAATDPLNLVGITSPGGRITAAPGNAVLYRNGIPIAAREAGQVRHLVDLESDSYIDKDLTLRRRPIATPAYESTQPSM